MIQFNLLPDVKTQFIRTQRLKRIMVLVSIALSVLSVLVLLMTISYSAVQKNHLSNLDKDIDKISAELQGNPELTKILSVQNQLNALPALYNGRPALDRLPLILERTTPVDVSIGRLMIDFSTSQIELSGQATTLEMVNSYVDTLKFTTFRSAEDEMVLPAFKEVVLSQFGKDTVSASFTLTFSFEPTLFDETKTVTISVPSTVTTRADGDVTELFNGGAEEELQDEEAQDGGQ